MAALNFHFHPAQQEVFNSPARFKVVVAGRRSGKTHYAAINLILEGMKNVSPRGFDMIDSHVYYIATSLPAARKNIWKKLKRIVRPILTNPTRDVKEKDMTHRAAERAAHHLPWCRRPGSAPWSVAVLRCA